MRLGYFYSRYPVISQTFCDAEMLALERLGFELEIGSVYPPLTSLRHEHIASLRAPIHYAPPQEILRISKRTRKRTARGRAIWLIGMSEIWPRCEGRAARAQRPLLCRPFQAPRRGSCSRPLRESSGAHRDVPKRDFRDSIQRHGARTGFHERPRQ